MIVDVHAHYLPQPMLDALEKRKSDFPSIDVMHDGDAWKLAFAGGPPTRPIMPNLRKSDARLKWMDDNHIDCQVCGGWLDSFGYEIPAAEGEKWSRFINEHLKRATEAEPRFAPLASVPLQSGKLAAKVLEEAVRAGFNGVMIGTQPKGNAGNLDDPDLNPFWERASELKATVYMHPMFGCGDPRLADYDMINAVGRGADTMTAVARLLFAGHFQKYPGMNMVLSHGGGGLPFLQGRLGRNHQLHPEYGDPVDGLSRCYYDTVLFDPRALRFLIECYGANRVMLGSDYPFPIGDMKPCAVVHNARLADIDTQAILGETATRLFRLPVRAHKH